MGNAANTFVCGVAPWQYELFKICMSLFLIKKRYFKNLRCGISKKTSYICLLQFRTVPGCPGQKGQCSTVPDMSVQDVATGGSGQYSTVQETVQDIAGRFRTGQWRTMQEKTEPVFVNV